MEEYPDVDKNAALILNDSVVEASRLAAMELKNKEGKGGKASEGYGGDEDDQE